MAPRAILPVGQNFWSVVPSRNVWFKIACGIGTSLSKTLELSRRTDCMNIRLAFADSQGGPQDGDRMKKQHADAALQAGWIR